MQLLITLISCLILYVKCKGLKEEFTWTRITYDISGISNTSTSVNTDAAYITFPGLVNSYVPSNKKGYKPSSPPTNSNSSSSSSSSSQPQPEYVYENNIPMGANRWKNKLFVTVPRRRVGVPSTLNYIDINSKQRHNVPLTPYPNYETNAFEHIPNRKNRFVSVYRVAIDSCDRLWFVDTGVVEIPGNITRVQPTTLFIIDLKTDTIIRSYQFKASDLRPATTLANLKVDVAAERCQDAFAYIPDLAGYGLVVYDFKRDSSWRIQHNYFYLQSLAGEFLVGGQRFQWNDGIFSITLSKTNSLGYRDAYFHSMAGTHMFRVSTRILKNETLATRTFHGNDFEVLGDRGENAQTSASDLHQTSGVLFLGLVNQNALGCWNTNKPFSVDNFDLIQKDEKKMIYPCDVKVYGDEVILLTNNMPIFLYSALNYDETNFRIWIEKVEKAVKDTSCAI